jgi:hypothetical protein
VHREDIVGIVDTLTVEMDTSGTDVVRERETRAVDGVATPDAANSDRDTAGSRAGDERSRRDAVGVIEHTGGRDGDLRHGGTPRGEDKAAAADGDALEETFAYRYRTASDDGAELLIPNERNLMRWSECNVTTADSSNSVKRRKRLGVPATEDALANPVAEQKENDSAEANKQRDDKEATREEKSEEPADDCGRSSAVAVPKRSLSPGFSEQNTTMTQFSREPYFGPVAIAVSPWLTQADVVVTARVRDRSKADRANARSLEISDDTREYLNEQFVDFVESAVPSQDAKKDDDDDAVASAFIPCPNLPVVAEGKIPDPTDVWGYNGTTDVAKDAQVPGSKDDTKSGKDKEGKDDKDDNSRSRRRDDDDKGVRDGGDSDSEDEQFLRLYYDSFHIARNKPPKHTINSLKLRQRDNEDDRFADEKEDSKASGPDRSDAKGGSSK